MTNLAYAEAAGVINQIPDMVKNLRPKPIFFYPYLERVLEQQFKAVAPAYPMKIDIAAENKYLLKKEFEPAQTIVIDKPITTDSGVPMWFETSTDQIFLRFGYTNCDARFISSIKMDMEFIHAFLGGSSGHGKSVTLNSMLGGLFYEYPPWELEVHMSDAKIIEFKKYGVGHVIPHISTIAATEDPDYVVSVLEKAKTEMNERAKIFGNIGASNLKSFRKMTGLAMPRVLIIMDEVESTFKMAGKQANRIADAIDAFARLGRAAGYHIFMATQNMSSDIPKSAIGQIRIRGCLGASQSVSESILGNTGAAENFGSIGKLIVNTEVLNGGNTMPANTTFQTPYLTDDDFSKEMEELETLGRSVCYNKTLAFYDEEDVKTLETFSPIMDKALARMRRDGEITSTRTVIPLGYPAFVSDDQDSLLKIMFDHKDVENIALLSTQIERLEVLISLIARATKDDWFQVHFSNDKDMFAWTPEAKVTSEARDSSQQPLSNIDSLIRKRLFLLYVDGIASNEKAVQYDAAAIEKIFAKDDIPKEAWGSSLMYRRAAVYYSMRNNPTHQTVWKPVESMFPSFKQYYNECVRANAIITSLKMEMFTKAIYFLGDISKIVGYGRDMSSRAVTALKKALQDSNRAGVVFVLYSRSMEGLNELASGLRYAVFDAPDSKDWGRLRTEAPPVLNNRLAVLYDMNNVQNPQRKFKRTLIKEEF